jgi:translation elongation factor EF-G
MKHITIGILAHVDAGKTTLSEALLYSCGNLRKLGRVDHKDAFLDTFALERARGITIFSKQAELAFSDDMAVTLLDTPGHVDFSAEMERTLSVLDYAILVINGADGVQGHTRTLWKLLKQYGIPVFLFVNKMDQPGTNHDHLLQDLQHVLDERCIEFVFSTGDDIDAGAVVDALEQPVEDSGNMILTEKTQDAVAMCEEALMEEFLQKGILSCASIQRAVAAREVFPCFFGSALKLDGVRELIQGLTTYADVQRDASASFGAKIYKISRDNQGNRLTHMKITSGSLKVKSVIEHSGHKEESLQAASQVEQADTLQTNSLKRTSVLQEKVNQIRIYSGASYSVEQEVSAGQVCAVTGLENSYCGEGLGVEADSVRPVLEPVLNYQLILPEGEDVHKVWAKLQQLEDENPLLRMSWEEATGEVHIQVMGEVELDILKAMIQERFQLDVSFGRGSLVYKETIAHAVEGVGHFEPLRHYAEVHLLMEPAEPGTGIQIETNCSEDILERNWQRLVVTHLAERKHPGVLTGSEITDMKITLVAGRAHTKHTEGGDFRQATYRAVRQGLCKAESVLLEPVYEYRLEVPTENAGRALSDIQKMYGTFCGPELDGDMSILTGVAPVSTMAGYQAEVNAYTHGLGKLYCSLKGYMPCHNTEEVIEQMAYDPEADIENPTGSVFCAHGAGFLVPWYQVEEYMHVDSGIRMNEEEDSDGTDISAAEPGMERYVPRKERRNSQTGSGSSMSIGEDEIREIFERTYGTGSMERRFYNKNDYDDTSNPSAETSQGDSRYSKRVRTVEKKEQYLLVDGYNIIFAWDDLKELSKMNLEAARGKLMDIMCNYQGYKQMNLILVFDAYKVRGNIGEVFDYHNIHVVYTKEAETADQYIEKLVHTIGHTYDVTVATSDGLEQLIVMGAGAKRLSARNLKEEVEAMEQELREKYLKE